VVFFIWMPKIQLVGMMVFRLMLSFLILFWILTWVVGEVVMGVLVLLLGVMNIMIILMCCFLIMGIKRFVWEMLLLGS